MVRLKVERKKRVMVPRTCLRCNKAFEADQRVVMQGGGKYCGLACFRGKRKYVDSTCIVCGKAFVRYEHDGRTGKYCGNDCFKKDSAAPVQTNTCQECGASFELNAHRISQGYGTCCSAACGIAHRKKQIAEADEYVMRQRQYRKAEAARRVHLKRKCYW